MVKHKAFMMSTLLDNFCFLLPQDYADKYTTYKVNNIDISTETADGKDTFHSMTKAVFQLQTEMTDSTAVHAEQVKIKRG